MTWNAEQQAYDDCWNCEGDGTYWVNSQGWEHCPHCLKRRIAELEAVIRPFGDIGRMGQDDDDLETIIFENVRTNALGPEAFRAAARALETLEREKSDDTEGRA